MAIAAPADDPNDGDGLFAGRYRLIAILKRGGMGVTYRAWDTRLRMPVVIKMPNESSRSDGGAMRRFAREIEAMLLLEHDHIVPIGNHGDEHGCPFVAMPFLPGGSLADMRRRDKNGNVQPQVPGTLPLWLPSIASALDFIHGSGLLHRDVKPGNIFFDGFWNAFLGDFGIAKVVDDSGGVPKGEMLTATMATIGTPEYMAPELFRPKAVPDSRSDQYSLAVTVYEMLAGEKPFTGSVAHIVIEHCTMPVPPLAARTQGLPASLCAAVEKALAKRPEDRFKTCGEFASAALRDVLPSPREPNMARLLCPSCSTILRMPTSAGGKVGRCPNCKAEMRIAKDLSALWLGGEEDGTSAAPSGQPFEAVAFEPAAAEPPALVNDPAATPAVESTLPRRQLAWIIAPVLAAVALSMIAGLLSHLSWKAYHERQVAVLIAEQSTRSQAAEGEWQKKVAAAEEQIAAWAKTSSESECLVKELREEVTQLEIMLDESEAVAKRLKEKAESAEVAADAATPDMQVQEGDGEDKQGSADAADGDGDKASQQQVVSSKPPPPPKWIEVEEATRLVFAPRTAGNRFLYLDEVSHLGVGVADILAKHRGDLGLNNLQELSDADATALAKHNGFLRLDGLTTLSDAAVRSLAKHKGGLTLKRLTEGLTALSPEAAKMLAQRTEAKPGYRNGRLDLSRLTSLTPEAAEALAQHKGGVHLHGLATLSSETAQSLSQHKGELCLHGLTSLSAEAANALAQHKGLLYLTGLTTLSPEAANSLAQHKGTLYLTGLTTLSPEVAEALAQHKDVLRLDGLVTLSDEAATALAQHKGELHLDRLTTLSVEAAESLAKQGGSLFLGSLTTLSPKVAEALAQHEGKLILNGLTTLSNEAAQAMSQHDGELRLDGLVTLSPEAAEALAQHEGKLILDSLMPLSPEVAKMFVKHAVGLSLSLDRLATLSSEVAEMLAQHEGELRLNGLATLSDEAATALAQHKGSLSLNGLPTLSPEAAEALAKHEGKLSLKGLIVLSRDALSQREGDIRAKTLSPDQLRDLKQGKKVLNPLITGIGVEAAQALAQQKDFLSLDSLTAISPEAARALAQHDGELFLTGLAALSPEAANALAQHDGELRLKHAVLSPEAAEALARHKGRLILDWDTWLSPEAIKALRKNPRVVLPDQYRR
jgi:hypothetical protein